MASALFKLSSDGGSTYEAAGTALADSEALAYASSGTYSIKAALNSTAGVDTALWSITSADDVNIASLPTVTQNSDKTCTFSVPKTGGAWLLQCKVNGGVNPSTGKADPSLTRALAIKVLNSAGQQEIAVGETTEAGAYGWTKAINDALRAGGSGLTESELRTVAAGLTASLDVNGQKITDLGTPTASTDAATKGYVDGKLPTVIYRQGVVSAAVGEYSTFAAALTAAQALPGRVILQIDDQDGTPSIPSGTHDLEQRIELVGLCAGTERVTVSVADGAVLQDCPRIANLSATLTINTVLFTSTRDGHDMVIDNAYLGEPEVPGSADVFNFNYTASKLTFRNGAQVQTSTNGLGEIPSSKTLTVTQESATLNGAFVAGGVGTLNLTVYPGNTVPDTSAIGGTVNLSDRLRDVLAATGGADYDLGAHKLTNVADPSSAQHAATKASSEAAATAAAQDEANLRAAATALTTAISVNGQKITDVGTPVDPDDAASKDYADSAAADEANWRYASSHLTANPDFNGKILTNLAAPTASGHAATRGYVDGSADVSLGSTSVSLSASNVATGHVKLTGTLSGDTTVTLPSGARSVWVTNGTSGTYTLKLAGNSSGAAYVAPGQTRGVMQDGSGVLRGEALRVVEYETSLDLSSSYTVGNHDVALFKVPAAFDVDRVEIRCTTSLSGGTATVAVGVSGSYNELVLATAVASAGDVVGLATAHAGGDFDDAIAAHYSTAQTITIRIAVSGGTLTAGALRVMVVGRYVGE